MAVVPVVRPVIAPVADPIVATEVVALAHVPPVVASVSVMLAPTHKADGPLIAAGNGFTVTVVFLKHPPGAVYVTIAVPAETPVTTPVDVPTVTVEAAVLHDPPAVTSASVIVLPPAHTLTGPVMTSGKALTVTVAIAIQPAPRE